MDSYHEETEEPPPTKVIVCKPTSIRVRTCFDNRRDAWSREVDALYHLSSPFIGSRLRNDSYVLASFRPRC